MNQDARCQFPASWYKTLMQKWEPFMVMRAGSERPIKVLAVEVLPDDLILYGNMRMLRYLTQTKDIVREPIRDRNVLRKSMDGLVCVERTRRRSNGTSFRRPYWIRPENVRPDDVILHNAHNVAAAEELAARKKRKVRGKEVRLLDNEGSHAARAYALFSKLASYADD